MQKLEIIGGKKISGTITISGSKNATLPILAATILTNKKIIIKNILWGVAIWVIWVECISNTFYSGSIC